MRIACFCIMILVLGWVRADFDIKRFHMVDQMKVGNHTNYLFRSNEPGVGRSFAYNQVGAALVQKIGSSFDPSDYYMVDINLLSVKFHWIETEREFFKKNPHLGKFVHKPIVGSLINPSSIPPIARKIYAKELNRVTIDDLPKFIPEIRDMLSHNYGKPAVILFHCTAGEDRTGEIAGSYLIKYGGTYSGGARQHYTFQQALAFDNENESRDIYCASANAFAWYCYYLYYEQGVTSLDCSWPSGKHCKKQF